MTLGSGLGLIVLGAILRFALRVEVSWISLYDLGNILMGAGVAMFILGLVSYFRKRSSVSTTSAIGPDGREQVIQRRTEGANYDDYR